MFRRGKLRRWLSRLPSSCSPGSWGCIFWHSSATLSHKRDGFYKDERAGEKANKISLCERQTRYKGLIKITKKAQGFNGYDWDGEGAQHDGHYMAKMFRGNKFYIITFSDLHWGWIYSSRSSCKIDMLLGELLFSFMLYSQMFEVCYAITLQ